MLGCLLFLSCGQPAVPSEDSVTESVSPVEVTCAGRDSLYEYTDLTAISVYLQKSYIKANINGYVQAVYAEPGKRVGSNAVLFSLITKEARAIGNTVNRLDPDLKFSGVSNIRSGQSGFVASVSHQKGDYVQEGESLATLSSRNSLVFLLDLPYELNALTDNNKTLEVILPDGEKLKGILNGALPAMDSVAQTQRLIIKVNPSHDIPEGLIAKVRVIKASSPAAQTLPVSAVLSNETEDQFWVMKMTSDSTAVRVPVKKGIQNGLVMEIIYPIFAKGERIISSGNYGLADTSRVKIVKRL